VISIVSYILEAYELITVATAIISFSMLIYLFVRISRRTVKIKIDDKGVYVSKVDILFEWDSIVSVFIINKIETAGLLTRSRTFIIETEDGTFREPVADLYINRRKLNDIINQYHKNDN
jgi:hypothetical protein